ncbi:MAG TPA: hypothetical protein VGE60_03730, partial [Telluria sp.]
MSDQSNKPRQPQAPSQKQTPERPSAGTLADQLRQVRASVELKSDPKPGQKAKKPPPVTAPGGSVAAKPAAGAARAAPPVVPAPRRHS